MIAKMDRDPEIPDQPTVNEEHSTQPGDGPDPEVVAHPQRRTFTAEYKQRILDAADACSHGELGALLRHEGLTYSTLRNWRHARDKAIRDALESKKPGPVPNAPNPLEQEVAELKRKLERANNELAKAKVIIDVQKKVSELLAPGSQDENGETSS